MKNKNFKVTFFILFCCFSVQSQMFDYTSNRDKPVKVIFNKYNTLSNIINNGFNAFEENLRILSLWEVNQYKRVILEIEKETVGMPSERKENYKNKKLLELSLLLNDKEMEMQFQYLELVDYFNDKAVESEIDAQFKPMMQIEGRLQEAVFKMAYEEIKEEESQNKIKSNASFGTDATLTSTAFLIPASSAIAAQAATGVGLPLAAVETGIIISGIAAEMMISYTVDKLVSDYLPDIEEMTKIKSWYFINGLSVHARKTYIEQLNSKRKF
tara:strand:+ start:365 stop:1174 length:810 start_codon:yes stop_codon:yes gene_type:complete